MIHDERPDLSDIPADVVAYIEALEARLQERGEDTRPNRPAALPDEPPTTKVIVTISRDGMVKRTPRHLYGRQRRGGMGIFDFWMCPRRFTRATGPCRRRGHAHIRSTDDGRAFRLPLSSISESPVRARGQALRDLLPLWPNERIVGTLPEGGGQYAVLLSKRGWARRVQAAYLEKTSSPALHFNDPRRAAPVAACWSAGAGDSFLASREGKGIRSWNDRYLSVAASEYAILTDEAVAVAGLVGPQANGVFLLGVEDGQGTVRLMSGFSANKAPGRAARSP